jgi:GDP/UDP-N,N'-diacetylbacillosamine 2-epimerase (hydrolysing)
LKIAILTSSRADYGILLPLLKELKKDTFFSSHLIAFGTHLSERYGRTIDHIYKDGFDVKYSFDSAPELDSPSSISNSMAHTMISLSKIWEIENYDLIIAIGDRYEMFSACASSIPFNLRIAHIHGGETTLGAFDDCFRNSITQMASLHFTAADLYKERVIQLKNSSENVFNVGALSIDNLRELQLLTIDEFKNIYNIDLSKPTILITFQPETVNFKKNIEYVSILISALVELKTYQLVITMPNADTKGNLIREKLTDFIKNNDNAYKIESFGTLGYLSCMKYCQMMLGNTSSGFIEASFFPKYVINIGERQLGRIVTPNIMNVKIEKEQILNAVSKYKFFKNERNYSIYGDGFTSKKIISILKNDK